MYKCAIDPTSERLTIFVELPPIVALFSCRDNVMMDTLNVADAISNIPTAAEYIHGTITRVADAPRLLQVLRNEIGQFRDTTSTLQRLLAKADSRLFERAALILLDDMVTILTRVVVSLSNLQPIIEALTRMSGALRRFEWPSIDVDVQKHTEELRSWGMCFNLVLKVLQRYEQAWVHVRDD